MTESLRITKIIDCIDYYMSWAWSFYLREQSSLYKYKRIMSSHLCFEWLLQSSSSKMSKMSIMLIMLTVITSDSSNQNNHFKTLITQWLFNHCCYIISCKRVLTHSIKMNCKSRSNTVKLDKSWIQYIYWINILIIFLTMIFSSLMMQEI